MLFLALVGLITMLISVIIGGGSAGVMIPGDPKTVSSHYGPSSRSVRPRGEWAVVVVVVVVVAVVVVVVGQRVMMRTHGAAQ